MNGVCLYKEKITMIPRSLHLTATLWRAVLAAVLLCCFGPAPLRAADEAIAVAQKLEEAFTAVGDKAKPAVVVITNRQNGPDPNSQQMPPELYHYFGIPMEPGPDQQQQRPDPRERRGGKPRPQIAGKGSGVIIRADGYIVTNYHVIQGNAALEVRLEDGRIFDSERDPKEVLIVGFDEDTDLAVLRVGNGAIKDLPVLPFADSDKVRVGQWAIAIGAPFNLDYSVTIGNVSQKGRHDTGMTTFENYIQTDASINPGNSGGPLLNINGEIIGINEFIMTGGMSRGSVGVGFAIASNLVRQVSDHLIEHGEVIRPFLGISMQPLEGGLGKQFGVEQGVLVSEAIAGDPADKAGIKAGDVVTHIGDKPVRTPHDLQFAVLAYKPGDKIPVRFIRQGETKTVEVIARQRGKGDAVAANVGGRQDMLDKVGLTVEATPDGLFISAVVSGSAADRAELRRGDRIIEVNQVETKTAEDVFAALQKTRGNVAVFYVDRRGSKRFVGVDLTAKPDQEDKKK
jgi:Do/DeqQ family serine protease